MAEKDYYKILGVEKNATKDEIKSAYKRLAKKYHPDVSKEAGAAEKFKEINEAAAVLGDDKKREQYDHYGTSAQQFGYDFSGQNFGGFGFEDFANFDFDDIFDRFFGGGFSGFSSRQSRRGSSRGSDLRYDMQITLEEASTGVTKHIVIPKKDTCPKCNGTGAEDEDDVAECSECRGSGQMRQTRRTPFGIFSTVTTCSNCNGSGEVIKHKCKECNGKGVVSVERKLSIDIPRGIEDGTSLRVAGQGEAGEKNGRTGDLYVVVRIKPHEYFERRGDDIYLEIPISLVQAMLGDEVEIPTIDGKAKLKIPAGTQPETTFRMRGKGIHGMRGFGSGDQLVKVKVQIPERLNKEQKELIEKFAKISPDKEKSFFSKLRDAF
ncbi:molecular chaperone DnaJ [Candidatus Woesearchaeota archaeon]|nr:molecular chaperone DnaJ [Candidatus Woesearchaeota archaeon]